MNLKNKLLSELEITYGIRNPNTSRFGSTSLGEIADQLCLSNSLLTKLLSGTATEGMYERYVPSDKVQDFCPCSAYEGDWVLNKSYTIPIPFNQPGLFYVARSSEIKLKCSSSETDELKGKKMHGFEMMNHEFWMDSQHEPLVPRFFDPNKKQFTKDYFNIDFESNPRYEKVANITSFFYNQIFINNDRIIREGEPAAI